MSFNEQEARDARGRWTAGTGGGEFIITEGEHTYTRWQSPGHPSISLDDASKFEGARRYALAVTDISKREGFDPGRINITDQEYQFVLNGENHHAAGTADRMTGQIRLYMEQLDPRSLNQVVTHEIMHQKFNAFLSDYEAEKREVQKLPSTGNYATDPMKGDGTLRAPYDTQFPTYTKYVTLLEGTNSAKHDRMAQEDGCTPYSKDWWDAYKAGTASWDKPIHETLAEMASLRSMPNSSPDAGPPTARRPTDKEIKDEAKTTNEWVKPRIDANSWLMSPKTSPDWSALYNAVNDNWFTKHAK